MQDSRIRNALSAVILILIIIIYTFYRMHDTGAISVTVGVDDSKIGIVVDSEEPVFIDLEAVQKVDFVETFNEEDYPGSTLCADENIDAFIIITTSDMVYIVNTSNKNTTKSIYQDIVNAVSE